MSALGTIDFYGSLGCKRLGDLVREELQGTEGTPGRETASKVRSRILERLPFFLEHNSAAIRATEWLKDEGNFTIRTFKKFTVTRSIKFAGAKSTISIEASAAARLEGKGGIELWLIDDFERVDMYEVAAPLCRLLFNTRKANDALLLMTILSSDLDTLWKRGYPGNHKIPSVFDSANWISEVDRVLPQRAPTNILARRTDKTALALPQTAQQKPKYMPTPAPDAVPDLRALRNPGYHGSYEAPFFQSC